MNLTDDQSGIAYAIVVAIISLVILSLVWSICSPAVEKLMGATENQLRGVVEDQERQDQIIDTYNFLNLVWAWWPIIMLGAIILWAIMQSQRPEYTSSERPPPA